MTMGRMHIDDGGKMLEDVMGCERRTLQNSELVEPTRDRCDATTHSHLNVYKYQVIQVVFRKTWQPGHDVSCSGMMFIELRNCIAFIYN
jgi:hypothetical protein